MAAARHPLLPRAAAIHSAQRLPQHPHQHRVIELPLSRLRRLHQGVHLAVEVEERVHQEVLAQGALDRRRHLASQILLRPRQHEEEHMSLEARGGEEAAVMRPQAGPLVQEGGELPARNSETARTTRQQRT